MSGKRSSLAVGSPNSRDRVKSKEQIIVATESGFFDGMLTFGWLAAHEGEALKVIGVNDALRYWLRANELTILLDEINADGIGVREFLERILQDEHASVGSIVEGNLRWITKEVEKLRYEDVALNRQEYELTFDTPIDQYTVQRTLRFVDHKQNASRLEGVLAGVRVVAPGAIGLRSHSERNRVDLVSACQVVREGDGWHVARYQGLLQQAWLRVKAVIRAGTQAGTVGLMGRNMSHNIGSHALFYLEMDEDEKKPEKKVFYRYLRERMELLAGFATSMPLSSSPAHLSNVIDNFRSNTELLQRIARSERVVDIEIVLDAKDDPSAAFPGGVLGAQALYAILENNIRDSAKHGRTKGSTQSSLELRISAHEPDRADWAEEFIEMVVSDNRKNYDVAQEGINASLTGLRIVDQIGSLLPGDWGIKERFIAAALLRGWRIEDIEIQRQVNRIQEINYFLGDYAPSGEPRILDVTSVDGNLGWVFYLLKPKDILLIGDFEAAEKQGLEEKFGDAINLYDFDWLKKNIALPSKVRHRFVVVYVNSERDLADLEALQDKLPYRVIVCLPKGLTLAASSDFAPISREDLDLYNLSLGRLYQLWVNWLVDLKHPTSPPKSRLLRVLNWMRLMRNSHTPEIAFRDDGLNALRLEDSTGMFHWEVLEPKDYEPNRPVLLFDRHGSCKDERQPIREEGSSRKAPMWTQSCQHFRSSIMHYETYEGGDALSLFALAATDQIDREFPDRPLHPPTLGFSFLEAGLTKILIVDERLDPTSEQMQYRSLSGLWQCSYKELFQWKGVDIRGGEFASNEIPPAKELVKWIKRAGYDFLVLHKGIVDKLIKRDNEDCEESPQKLMADLFATLQEHVRHIIIHSGRMSASELPPGVKFMSLSNVDTWIKNNCPKMQIVEDLCLLRRP